MPRFESIYEEFLDAKEAEGLGNRNDSTYGRVYNVLRDMAWQETAAGNTMTGSQIASVALLFGNNGNGPS